MLVQRCALRQALIVSATGSFSFFSGGAQKQPQRHGRARKGVLCSFRRRHRVVVVVASLLLIKGSLPFRYAN